MISKLFAAGLFALFAMPGLAAPCGNTAAGFDAWKVTMAQEAASDGVGKAGQAALLGAQYSNVTIGADRNQKSFKYSCPSSCRCAERMRSSRRDARARPRTPRSMPSLEAAYGVPAGVLLAIHGMETGFGNFMGDTNVVSAIATLT